MHCIIHIHININLNRNNCIASYQIILFILIHCTLHINKLIIQAILESDFIKYTIQPVAGPDDLTSADTNLIQDNDEVSSYHFQRKMCINCITVKINHHD